MVEEVGQQYDLHEISCVRQRGFTGTEGKQYRIQKEEPQNRDCKANNKIQDQGIPRILVASVLRCCPNRMETMVDAPAPIMAPKAMVRFIRGMGQCQAGNSQRANSIADKDTVYDVIKGRCCHSYDGRQRVMQQQLTDGVRSQATGMIIFRIDVRRRNPPDEFLPLQLFLPTYKGLCALMRILENRVKDSAFLTCLKM